MKILKFLTFILTIAAGIYVLFDCVLPLLFKNINFDFLPSIFKRKKAASSIGVIEESDGPTAVYVVSEKKPIWEKIFEISMCSVFFIVHIFFNAKIKNKKDNKINKK